MLRRLCLGRLGRGLCRLVLGWCRLFWGRRWGRRYGDDRGNRRFEGDWILVLCEKGMLEYIGLNRGRKWGKEEGG